MAIKTGLSSNGTVIASTDTTLLNAATDTRLVVTLCNLHEQTGAAETVELFISTDSSSAAGERIDDLVFAANESKSPITALLAIPAGSYLIGKAGTGALVECNIVYTLYDGTDV